MNSYSGYRPSFEEVLEAMWESGKMDEMMLSWLAAQESTLDRMIEEAKETLDASLKLLAIQCEHRLVDAFHTPDTDGGYELEDEEEGWEHG